MLLQSLHRQHRCSAGDVEHRGIGIGSAATFLPTPGSQSVTSSHMNDTWLQIYGLAQVFAPMPTHPTAKMLHP